MKVMQSSTDLDFDRFMQSRYLPRVLRERFIVPASVQTTRDYDLETAALLEQTHIEYQAAVTPLPYGLNDRPVVVRALERRTK